MAKIQHYKILSEASIHWSELIEENVKQQHSWHHC
ncbi:hypothetical protein T4D_12323, partial [Trichinella pseudospiralis]